MKVNIKEDRSIPEGYTYSRCDTYTAEELIKACSLADEFTWRTREWRNPHAVAYVKAHPKETYNVDDNIAIMRMTSR